MEVEILKSESGNKRLDNDTVVRFSDMFFVLSIPLRMSIADFLVQSEAPQRVTEIVAACDSEQAVVSGHLKILYQKGIVERERRGICVYYSIVNPDVINFVKWVHEWVLREDPTATVLRETQRRADDRD